MTCFFTRRPVSRFLATIAGVLSALCLNGILLAQSTIQNDLIYYEIGGGRAVHGPAGYGRNARIRGDGSLALGYSCGRFDLRNNLEQMFSRFSSGLDQAVDTLTYAATGAVASLPLYLLRQANPNLANMLENTLLRYEEEFRIAVKECEDAEGEILDGRNPYYNWVRWGRQDTWRQQAGSGATADEVRDTARGTHGCVTWIGGERVFCNDADTREVRVIEEVSLEGYRILVEADSNAGGTPPGAPPSRLSIVWPTAEEAVADILEITGETVVTNVRTTPPAAQPPRGITTRMTEDAVQGAQALNEAVDRQMLQDTPDRQELDAIGVPGLTITPSLLWALGSMTPDMRTASIDRISTEIALLRALEKVNLARRVVLAGARMPEVEASPAGDIVQEDAIRLLEMEAELLRDEYDLRTRAASSTAARIIRTRLQQQRVPVRGTGGSGAAPQGGAILR